MTESKKVLCPVENPNGKTWWMRVGRAYINKDGSTNVYLEAFPANKKLQIRDWDEDDRKRQASLDLGGGAADKDMPF